MFHLAYYVLHAGQPSARRLIGRVANLRNYQSASSVGGTDVVIRYGPTNESDPGAGTTLNPQTAVARTLSRPAMGRFLRRVGVRFTIAQNATGTTDEPRFARQYRIPFFDMLPLACFRSDSSDAWINNRIQRVQPSFREVSMDEEKVTIRVMNLASRTLHALGLDFGLVSVGMTQKGILHVLDVTASPVLEGRLLDIYANAVESFISREERLARTVPTSVTLGTDLEVMLRGATGKMVLASQFFTRQGRVGCDDRSIQFDGKRLPLMELRPDPDSSPLGLYNKLREVMQEAVYSINRSKVEWRAGSMPFRPYCTGGHIHFSGIPFSHQFVKALDNYVGLPLMMVENKSTAILRRPRYGFLGDVRQKNYGGFEYRTPASFVVSPDVTMAAFCLAYLTALHYRDLPITDLCEPHLQHAFYKGNGDTLRPIVERNIFALRRLPSYSRYQEYLDPFFDLLFTGWSWNENVDIRVAWGLPFEKPNIVKNTRQRAVRRVKASG